MPTNLRIPACLGPFNCQSFGFLADPASPMMDVRTSWRSLLHSSIGGSLQKSCFGLLRLDVRLLDKNYGLGTRNLESSPAAHVSTSQHVVDSDHIIAGLLKASPIHLVCALRWLCFPGSLKPAHVIFSPFTTMRTAVSSFLNFFFLVKEISFVHSHYPS